MLTVLLAGPGGNWTPLLLPLFLLGLVLILGNKLYLMFRQRNKSKLD
jgi:hypothetical protein